MKLHCVLHVYFYFPKRVWNIRGFKIQNENYWNYFNILFYKRFRQGIVSILLMLWAASLKPEEVSNLFKQNFKISRTPLAKYSKNTQINDLYIERKKSTPIKKIELFWYIKITWKCMSISKTKNLTCQIELNLIFWKYYKSEIFLKSLNQSN